MIEIKDGKGSISGARYELLTDTVQLFNLLLESAPEILIACITGYDTELQESLSKSDPFILNMLSSIIIKLKGDITK